MEKSFVGLYWTIFIVGLFITAIFGFITLFPQEQGVVFSGQAGAGYIAINNTDTDINPGLMVLSNQSSNALDKWDLTIGQMGSNQIKQGQSGMLAMMLNTAGNVKFMAIQIFTDQQGNLSPIVYVLGLFIGALGTYFGFVLIKFLRTGN